MRNKRGQFFIVAALIIVMIMGGMANVATYAIIKSEPKAIQSISDDLKQEAPRIIDYGVYNKTNLNDLLINFANSTFAFYFLERTDYSNVSFIIGNKTNLYQVEYVKVPSGGISIMGPSWPFTRTNVVAQQIIPSGETVSIIVLGKEFFFDLRENEMFYFVITKEKEGEIYIEKNE